MLSLFSQVSLTLIDLALPIILATPRSSLTASEGPSFAAYFRPKLSAFAGEVALTASLAFLTFSTVIYKWTAPVIFDLSKLEMCFQMGAGFNVCPAYLTSTTGSGASPTALSIYAADPFALLTRPAAFSTQFYFCDFSTVGIGGKQPTRFNYQLNVLNDWVCPLPAARLAALAPYFLPSLAQQFLGSCPTNSDSFPSCKFDSLGWFIDGLVITNEKVDPESGQYSGTFLLFPAYQNPAGAASTTVLFNKPLTTNIGCVNVVLPTPTDYSKMELTDCKASNPLSSTLLDTIVNQYINTAVSFAYTGSGWARISAYYNMYNLGIRTYQTFQDILWRDSPYVQPSTQIMYTSNSFYAGPVATGPVTAITFGSYTISPMCFYCAPIAKPFRKKMFGKARLT